MIVDNITIVICAVLIVLVVLSSLLDLFFKKIPTSGDEDGQGSDACQPVSVIIICDNNAEELRTNLPVFLEQDYPAGYELIVVIDKDEFLSWFVKKAPAGDESIPFPILIHGNKTHICLLVSEIKIFPVNVLLFHLGILLSCVLLLTPYARIFLPE